MASLFGPAVTGSIYSLTAGVVSRRTNWEVELGVAYNLPIRFLNNDHVLHRTSCSSFFFIILFNKRRQSADFRCIPTCQTRTCKLSFIVARWRQWMRSISPTSVLYILNNHKNNLATISCNPVLHTNVMTSCLLVPLVHLGKGMMYFYDVIRCVLWFHNGISCSILTRAVDYGTPLIVWWTWIIKPPYRETHLT